MFLIKEHIPGGGKMKRNAVAVAVGALLLAPAAQAQIMLGNDTIGTVQFYGKLYPQFMYGTSKGATQPGDSVSTLVSTSEVLTGSAVTENGARWAVDTQNSYLGFRGERGFGAGGLKAIWQIESSVNFEKIGRASCRERVKNAGGGAARARKRRR